MLLDREPVRFEHGEWYHARCEQSSALPERVTEPPAVLCVVCYGGINNVAQLALTDAGPAHVGCDPDRKNGHHG